MPAYRRKRKQTHVYFMPDELQALQTLMEYHKEDGSTVIRRLVMQAAANLTFELVAQDQSGSTVERKAMSESISRMLQELAKLKQVASHLSAKQILRPAAVKVGSDRSVAIAAGAERIQAPESKKRDVA